LEAQWLSSSRSLLPLAWMPATSAGMTACCATRHMETTRSHNCHPGRSAAATLDHPGSAFGRLG
jgi:hypothetical protein